MTLPVQPLPALSAAQKTAGGGGLQALAYQWAITCLSPTGESGLSAPAGYTPTANDSAALTSIPLGPTSTTSRNVYRTKGGGTVFFFVGNIPDNVATTFTDTLPDAALGGEAPARQFFVAAGDIQGAFLMFDDEVPAGSANYGLLNIGPGPWDGATGAFFAGSSVGTCFAIAMPAAHTGNFLDFQAAGVSMLSVNKDGLLVAGSHAASHFGGIATSVKAGTPADSDFTAAPPDGTIVGDATAGKIWIRLGAAWKGVAVT